MAAASPWKRMQPFEIGNGSIGGEKGDVGCKMPVLRWIGSEKDLSCFSLELRFSLLSLPYYKGDSEMKLIIILISTLMFHLCLLTLKLPVFQGKLACLKKSAFRQHQAAGCQAVKGWSLTFPLLLI